MGRRFFQPQDIFCLKRFFAFDLLAGGVNPRVCICCGEPMSQRDNALSRNPNMCASCSSLLDGMDDSSPIIDVSGSEEAPLPDATAPAKIDKQAKKPPPAND